MYVLNCELTPVFHQQRIKGGGSKVGGGPLMYVKVKQNSLLIKNPLVTVCGHGALTYIDCFQLYFQLLKNVQRNRVWK